MPRGNAKSISVLKTELERLIDSFRNEGFDIDEMKTTHREWESASKFLRRNKHKNDCCFRNEKYRIIEKTKHIALKYEKIMNIQRKIRRKKRKVLQDITTSSQNNINREESKVRNVHHNITNNHTGIQPHQNENIHIDHATFENSSITINSSNISEIIHDDDDFIIDNVLINQDTSTINENTNNDFYDEECDNCHRKQCINVQDPYILQFHIVNSENIRKQGKFKFIKSSTGRRSREYTLCQECHEYCVQKKDPRKCAWPAFLWNLLSGYQKSVFRSQESYHGIYSGEILWRFVPVTM